MVQPGLIGRLLPAALIVLCTSGPISGQETGDLDQLRRQALELVNESRRERALEPLSQSETLDTAAQNHAEDMLQRDYYAHVSPEGDTVMDRYIEAGGSRWRLTAENIARCRGCPSPPTSDRVENLHRGWMNSPPHRENILQQGLDRFGFGIIVGPDQTLYAVQTFSGAGRPRNMQPGESADAIGAERQTEVALQRINKERQAMNREPLEVEPVLIRAASNLIPQDNLESSSLGAQGSLAAALPSNADGDWRSLAAFVGRCGGCGTHATAADARYFVEQWMNDQSYKDRLLSEDVTHLGLVIRADGEGLKVAAAILGQHR